MIERRDQVLEQHPDPLRHQVVRIPPIRPLVGVECRGSTMPATTPPAPERCTGAGDGNGRPVLMKPVEPPVTAETQSCAKRLAMIPRASAAGR
mgnify:CR=1 FL=1